MNLDPDFEKSDLRFTVKSSVIYRHITQILVVIVLLLLL